MSEHLHKVTRCAASCPFYENEWDVCTKAKSDDPDAWPSHRSVPHPENMGPPPEWCPLRSGGVLVVLDVKATP